MSPVIIRLDDENSFASSEPVLHPVGYPVVHARTGKHHRLPEAETGFWECTVGKFRRQIKEAEYSYIICGKGCFTPDSGNPIEFRAGDAIYFSANTEGTWEIRETLRKTYFILG